MVYFKFEQGKKIITALSVGLSIIAVFGYGKRAVCDNRNVLIIVY